MWQVNLLVGDPALVAKQIRELAPEVIPDALERYFPNKKNPPENKGMVMASPELSSEVIFAINTFLLLLKKERMGHVKAIEKRIALYQRQILLGSFSPEVKAFLRNQSMTEKIQWFFNVLYLRLLGIFSQEVVEKTFQEMIAHQEDSYPQEVFKLLPKTEELLEEVKKIAQQPFDPSGIGTDLASTQKKEFAHFFAPFSFFDDFLRAVEVETGIGEWLQTVRR